MFILFAQKFCNSTKANRVASSNTANNFEEKIWKSYLPSQNLLKFYTYQYRHTLSALLWPIFKQQLSQRFFFFRFFFNFSGNAVVVQFQFV